MTRRAPLLLITALAARLAPAAVVAGRPAATLQARIDAAPPGGEVLVAGVHRGGVVIRKPLRLVGAPGAVIDGEGRGTVVRVTAPGVVLSRLTLRRSGADLNTEDAGVLVTGPQVLLEDVRLEQVLFGLNLKRAHGAVVRRVAMTGMDLPLSRRGDAVRLWDSDRVTLSAVRVRRLRDVLIWFSDHSVLHDAEVRESRYGVHLMYADGFRLLDSRFEANAVGGYVMYSTGVRIEGNRFLRHRGSTAVGLALKESDGVAVRRNLLAGNQVGLYVDGTPRVETAGGEITDNVISGNGTGLLLLANAAGNVIAGNVFEANARHVAVTGGRTPATVWTRGGRGNYWDDYVGLDGDGDGVGDLPYRAREWFEGLEDRVLAARLLQGSLAVPALDFAARLFPVFAPQVVVEDPHPLTRVSLPAEMTGGRGSPTFAAVALGLTAAGAALLIPAGRTGRAARALHRSGRR
jgi:nitrous oxidase accessory protein